MTSTHSRVALVTGAASGIGRAVAATLASAGADLLLVDIDAERLHATAAAIGNAGTTVEVLAASVSDPDTADRCAHSLGRKFGRVDYLVNSAGILDGYAPLAETTPELLRRVVEVNVFGAVYMCRAIIPRMAEAGYGKVINIASVASHIGNAGGVSYTISKHALLGLTRSLAATEGPKGVRVNAVCPGAIRTELRDSSARQLGDLGVDMQRGIGAAGPDVLARLIPLGDAGEVQHVADCVRFLCSDGGDYVNGADLVVDGGLLVRRS
jgi:NAD(P)-dependent dehydrogenase (short-subunit alcohol dehydrogenase family)